MSAPSATTETAPSPWHAGELQMQRHVGVAERMAEVGRRVLRDHLIDQHRAFYPLLSFVVLGAVDEAGDAWATLRAGQPGFLSAPDRHALQLAVTGEADDPAEAGLHDGGAVGLLGIDLMTRRRNRLNGVVRRQTAASFAIDVVRSYGNCPQYIQRREFRFVREPGVPSSVPVRTMGMLDADSRRIIEGADTLFVASYVDREDGTRHVDVSHRGGRAGFVRIGDDGVLTIPDFAGNLFFNTLGNFLVNSKAGLVFVDFTTGDLLQLTGDAEVLVDSPEIVAFQGAERLWRFTPRRVVHRPDALPLRWNFQPEGWSPNSLMTGSWAETADRLKALERAQTWRPFRVARVVDEAEGLRSFHLEPADGAGLIPHQAGQFLPIRVQPPGAEARLLRTYTLSTASSDHLYRISVKREGLVSQHLHGLVAGDVIEARAPGGAFTIDATERRPAVLLAAGIGITPILAMARHLVYEGLRLRRLRPAFVFQAARHLRQLPFAAEFAELSARSSGALRHLRVLGDATDAVEGRDYEAAGRINMQLLKQALPFDDYDFYLCGPPAFMQAIYDGLRALNVADARIHAEAFGPAGITRQHNAETAPQAPLASPATQAVPVLFVGSGKEARWAPGSGSLLELAEARGLQPAFSCRGGSCGSCRTRIVSGTVAYPTRPEAPHANDEALICCAVPAANADGSASTLQLDL